MSKIRFLAIGMILVALTALVGSAPLAQTPSGTIVSYRGTLTDWEGAPLNQTATMQFALYDSETGGNLLWGPETHTVEARDGSFEVLLGSLTPMDPTKVTGDAYLEIVVNGEALLPRELFSAAACAVGVGPEANCTCDNLTVNGYADLTDGEIKQVNAIRGDLEYISFYAADGGARGIRVGKLGVDSSYSNADSKLDSVGGNSLWVKNTIWAGGPLWSDTGLSIYGNGYFGKPGTGEGGEIELRAGQTGNGWVVDNYYGQFRLHHDGTVYLSVGASGGLEAVTSGGTGVYGKSTSGKGVYGETTSTSSGYGVYAKGKTAVKGYSTVTNGTGVLGHATNGASAWGVWGWSDTGYAGWFSGKTHVNGAFTASDKQFLIDHPLDPANMYLYHATVESSDMKTMYDGLTVLDANGEAVVKLPDWFEALNRDFRYQLTCVGGYAPVYIAHEIKNNEFKIAGGKPGMKVSWQVTGIRHDPWAEQHPLQVEVDKGEKRGTYLYPEGYGQPETLGAEYERQQALQEPSNE